MKAVVYKGPNEVNVEEVPDATIERPTDVLVRITATNICGSDLHMYEGRTNFETGRTFGHENMGEVIEVGNGVDKVKVGERVVLPFNISCGFCKNCERGFTNYCMTTQSDPVGAGAAYGFAGMGPYPGGQAQMLRVPYGDNNCLRLGEDAVEKQNDYVMLSDIFPTGYHATEMAGIIPGDTVVIYGAGPVGLMAALSATIKGASKVWVVDRRPDRLALAEQIGAIAIDDSKTDPVQFVLDQTKGIGADRGCECVGYQAHDPQGTEDPAMTLNRLIQSVRITGGIGVVGVFLPADPGGIDENAKQGKIAIDYGLQWLKGINIGSGQCPVKKYNRQLRELIAVGKAKPSWIVSHEIPLSDASDAYKNFRDRTDGWTKVILKPE
ncbi:glutathione-independent formaldehyde dehydrogenase [Cryobacterium sp. CG_9.6]|uniref:glutathione-independent formaldehyde dehydrogenase n=1 Tax=Cryobacterium sp. CG_9.6 TaxID=2760710 RepID=UPI0024745DE6|nr:glutathione-independent formaldehyde dehydrogenase [Cryobacterium sp. CG_9.6]MDH6238496.1 glutathione-independent formaldehyde dehydrogenase [Cryobacterium sp. CG_9.6]